MRTMKIECNIFLLMALLFLLKPVMAKQTEPRFKPGDWFEAEMEFVNDVPVFHNHWANNDVGELTRQYIVARFYLEEIISDTISVWNYKIIRIRFIEGIKPSKFNDNTYNAFCFDSWYPDYFMDGFDSISESLSGKLKLINNVIDEHYNNYSKIDDKYLNLHGIFSVGDGNGYFGRSSMYSDDNRIANYLEIIFSLTFGSENIVKSYSLPSRHLSYKRHPNSNNDSVSFSIRNIDFSNNYTAYLLPNGLAYAFKDKYKQKVMSITNASFALPNKAVVTIYDKRSKKEDEIMQLDNISILFSNPAHVVSQNIIVKNNCSELILELKCIVELTLLKDKFLDQDIFIEPGDSVEITIGDDENITPIISGINNVLVFQQLQNGTNDEIQASTLSSECKEYLILKNRIESTYSELMNTHMFNSSDINYFHSSVIDFYSLKSFHYKTLYELDNSYTVIGMGNIFHLNNVLSRGAPMFSNFKYKYYSSLSYYSHFSLYANLLTIMKEGIVLDHEEYYNEFLSYCGDTIMTKYLNRNVIGVKSVQVGKKMPITKLHTDIGEYVDIMPQDGKFGLLILYSRLQYWNEERDSFINQIPENIQYVTCLINLDSLIKLKEPLPGLTLAEADSLELYAHPSMTDTLINLLYRSPESILILYDSDGTIWYNTSFHPSKEYGNEQYINAIKDAIQKAKAKPIKKSKNILLIILLSVIGSVTLTFLFYRIRIAQLKKKNARQQLIQELKLKSVQSQLNPHFLFNALNSIQVLVKSGDTKQADNYLVGFSELLRNVLQNAEKRLVPLSDELAMINRYCELEKLRMNFNCELDIQTTTAAELIEIPYMLLQPVIENAIKHGLAKATDMGLLQITIIEKNASLHIRVIDNGPGIHGASLETLKEKGRGLKLSLEKLYSIYGNDAEFVILDAKPGTEVSITLKIG